MIKKSYCIIFLSLLWNYVSANTNGRNEFDHVVLDPGKSFIEQLTKSNTIYEIPTDYDLRQNIKAKCESKVFVKGQQVLYRDVNAILLVPDQGIWVPKGCLILNSSMDRVLSDSCYIPSKTDSVFLVSSQPQEINYQISGIVTMPEGCVLKFSGGKLSNGIIRSVRTCIEANPVKIFGENMSFAWYWDIQFAYPEWFGAKGDKTCDDGESIQRCLDAFKNVYLTNHKYYCFNPIKIPSQGCLRGRGMYKTTIIFTKEVDYMICSPNNNINDVVIENINLSCENDRMPKYGVLVHNATRTKIESVWVASAEIGFALNSFYCSQIKNCTAHDCNIGFYLGLDGGSCTSVDYENCYANKCTIGHLFRNCSYVTTKNTAADYCETAYDFIESCLTLISPGAECSKFFLKIVPHREASKIGNYAHNNIHIINGMSIYNEPNDEGVIFISTNTRAFEDRNRVVIDGFNIYFGKNAKDLKLLHKDGDTVLHLNNLTSFVVPDIEAINYYRDGKGYVQTSSTLRFWSDKTIGTSIFVKNLNKQVFWNGINWVDSSGIIIQ